MIKINCCRSEQKTDIYFNSPSKGKTNFANMARELIKFMKEGIHENYRLIIGTDSRADDDAKTADFVTAIVIHRVGRGARYFWRKETKHGIHSLRQRMYEEAIFSLVFAQELLEKLKLLNCPENDLAGKSPKYALEIHVDIGKNGPTRVMIQEIVGMLRGSGFSVKTKPDGYGASKVADKHTRTAA